ncbi:hypothetical protein QYE76_049882 [Lolium multiflorum]|uniref:Uncharacterized protein n=1 Tax=Lolium multiflorum TaxID=4521 RepID=A0AAD8SNU5_LOLMU|nr:hypothetical protein QYE76_049882 [Lolium multiflorum]
MSSALRALPTRTAAVDGTGVALGESLGLVPTRVPMAHDLPDYARATRSNVFTEALGMAVQRMSHHEVYLLTSDWCVPLMGWTEQCEEARKKAESDAVEARQEADKAKADAAGVEDLRKRLHDAETSLSEHITAQSAREAAITKRIRTQNRRFVNRTSQEFELENPDNDSLLDAVSFLEFHGTEAREGMDEARAGLSKLFPYFFPKKEEPATFLGLAKCFNPPEDLGLKMRHENMKVAVESTVALVADSQQTIDWARVGDTEQIEQTK